MTTDRCSPLDTLEAVLRDEPPRPRCGSGTMADGAYFRARAAQSLELMARADAPEAIERLERLACEFFAKAEAIERSGGGDVAAERS